MLFQFITTFFYRTKNKIYDKEKLKEVKIKIDEI